VTASKSTLDIAVAEGNLEAIRSLLDAGADVRYVRPRGYTVMIDVMHGRSIADDEMLIPILRLLIDHGADINAVSDYGESALSVASNMGRFDAVGLLLDAGADPSPLEWTPLMRAVALGTVADVCSQIENGDNVAARDRWERTPWLLSLQTGDVAKAEALLATGAGNAECGRCGKTPLMYPIGNRHIEMVRWLLAHGADPNQTDDYGGTALIEAASGGATDCVRALLDAGADLHQCSSFHSPIGAASTLAVVRTLVEATLPHLPHHVRVMVELLFHTGMRPAEVCGLRLKFIDRTGPTWVYRPEEYKTAYAGKSRLIPFGPKARQILESFLQGRSLHDDEHVFSPRRAREERFERMRTGRKSKVQPSQVNRKKKRPRKTPGEQYGPTALCRAVAAACKRAGIPHWHPYQLRHSFATRVRKHHGLEAAQVLLGHARADVTQMYAKRDLDLAMSVAAAVG